MGDSVAADRGPNACITQPGIHASNRPASRWVYVAASHKAVGSPGRASREVPPDTLDSRLCTPTLNGQKQRF